MNRFYTLKTKLHLPLLILFFLSVNTYAQSLPADRPGVGFTSGLTTKGDVILESGTTIRSGLITIGEVFLKSGIRDDLELQFHTGSLLWNTNADNTSRSTPAILAKYKPNWRLPASLNMSILARTFLPFLDENSSTWQTQVLVLADYQFTDTFSLSINTGYGDFVDSIGDGIFTFTTNPGVAVTPRLSVYGGYGWYGDTNGSYSLIEAGLTFMQRSHIQLDAGFQYDENDQLFLTGGIIIGL